MDAHSLTSCCLLVALATCLSCAPHQPAARSSAVTVVPPAELLPDVEHALKASVLDAWFPRCVDTVNGGYRSAYTSDWTDSATDHRMLVTQARHLFSSSLAAKRYPADPVYRAAAAVGLRWFREHGWDSVYGGWFYNLDATGRPASLNGDDPFIKDLYAHAFVILALAAHYDFSRDTVALRMAVATFRWYDSASHDRQYGGYYSRLGRDGSVGGGGSDRGPSWRWRPPMKDQNSVLHLLESYNVLYRVWPDDTLRARMAELVTLWCTRMTDPRGFTRLEFMPDWSEPQRGFRGPRPDTAGHGGPATPSGQGSPPPAGPDLRADRGPWQEMRRFPGSTRSSFGHDLEFAYFALEAAELLGLTDPAIEPAARRVVDQALKWGWDRECGGLFAEGTWPQGQDSCIVRRLEKDWWVEAEALHILLFMARHYQSADYYERFLAQWEFVRRYCIDSVNGGWYPFSIDRTPRAARGPKGHDWKASYHDGRALVRCVEMLADTAGWGFLGER